MPDIHFDCPRCNQPIDAPGELANQLTECPTCKETIEVPLRSRAPKPQFSAPPPVRQPAANPNLRLCPACRAQVSYEAEICPHCGHPLKSGFLGKAGTERTLNTGVLIIILAVIFLSIFGFGSCARF
jgi:uncharacterized paraquat-inducible protein A